MKMQEKQDIFSVLDRTFNNCEYYEKTKQYKKLHNEIGVLRGVLYCVECFDKHLFNTFLYDDKLIHFIDLQNKYNNK